MTDSPIHAASTDHEYHWTNGLGYRSELREKFVASSEIQPTSGPEHSSES